MHVIIADYTLVPVQYTYTSVAIKDEVENNLHLEIHYYLIIKVIKGRYSGIEVVQAIVNITSLKHAQW